MSETMSEQTLEALRMVEALLFASDRPLGPDELKERLPGTADLQVILDALRAHYEGRGVELVEVNGKFLFRTAPDLAFLMRREVEEERKLSRAAVETLAIIAYKQPVTRAEIEDIRGVSISKGTLDVLMEAGWVKMRGRRKTPGRPVTYGTTEDFLVQFGLADTSDLPGLTELKAAGLLDSVDDAFERLGDQDIEDEDDGQIDLEDAIAMDEKREGEARRAADQPASTSDAGQDDLFPA